MASDKETSHQKLLQLVQSHPSILAAVLQDDKVDQKPLEVGKLPPAKPEVVKRLNQLLDDKEF